ncbi:MAG: CDP-alcohol phosphatidyltransferase family protein [Planctomycetota bacterium]
MATPLKSLSALPTLVTLGNTFCGLLGVTYVIAASRSHGIAEALSGQYALLGPDSEDALAIGERIADARAEWYGFLVKAVWAQLAAAFFDFMDGKVARLTKSESDFGVQMDSLSDVISFGLLPVLMFNALFQLEFGASGKLALILSAFYLFGAVLRLARFNVEASEGDDDHRAFRGLPSPAAAAGLASLVYLYCERDFQEVDDVIRAVCPWMAAILGFLMWTKLPYIHFVNVVLTERRNFAHLFLVVVAIFAIAYKPPLGIAVIMAGYALSGPLMYLHNLVRGRSTVDGESLI